MSVTSTTGFATADSTLWTPFAITILIFFSIQCGCAGSTAGGIKADRVLLAGKVMKSRIRQQQHPNAILRIKLNNVLQDNELIQSSMIFIVAYMMIVMIGTVVNTFFGVDLMTSFSVAFASMGNIGPGFGEVGSMNTYSALPDVVKLNSTLIMLLGRLEIFGFIQLFLIKWWK